MNIINLLKSKKYTVLTIIFLISVFYIVIQANTSKQEDLPKSTSSEQISKYKNLTLGTSNRNDIVKEIGSPQNEYLKDNKTILEYSTLNPNYNDQFVVENNNLKFVRKVITIQDTIRTVDLEKENGKEDFILYGPGSGIDLYLYVYNSKGFAFLGHKISGYVNELWYFEPTDKDTFLKNFGEGYSETKSEKQ